MPGRKASKNANEDAVARKKTKITADESKSEVVTHSSNGCSESEGETASKAIQKTGDELTTKCQWNTKIVSWNVAGVRAWVKKDGVNWLKQEAPDIICLQETKCSEKDIPQALKDMKDYKIFWNVAKSTKGFSGVALMSKVTPLKVDFGLGIKEHDQEGRTITAEYDQFYLVTVYVPNSQRGLKRLNYRMQWNKDFMEYINKLDSKKPVVLCGDMNVSHLEIDLANPKSNRRSAGFTQEERDSMSELLDSGYIDTYRHFYPDLEKKYTFWTYMANARAKNVGWRLDYFITSKRWIDNMFDNVIASSVMGSDHCPIVLLLTIPK